MAKAIAQPTKKQIIEGNKIIAFFMGGNMDADAPEHWIENVHYLPGVRITRFHVEQGEYQTSWDWLMPVIEEIEALPKKWPCLKKFEVDIKAKICTISDDDELVAQKNGNTRIEAAWLCVVEFIQWYEENKEVNSSNV